jgi:hypothetical protein
MSAQPDTSASAIARLCAVAPDAATAALYAWTWIDPLHFSDSMVKSLMLMMMMEFLVVHSGAFIGLAVLSDSATRQQKTFAILGFGAFYMLFAGAFSLAFHSWWPALSFIWLLVAKFAMVWLTPLPPSDEVQRVKTLWGLSVVAYLGSVFAGVFVPLPPLGITPEIIPKLGLVGGGLWIDHPQTVIFSGAIYFALVAWSRWAYRGKGPTDFQPDQQS